MCLYPVSIKTVDSFGLPTNLSVPCGKCIECLKDKQNSWKIRLMEECRDHLYMYFFTLTYNDDSISRVKLTESLDPKIDKILNHDGFVYTVNKSDVQKWLKRNRIYYERYFKREVDFKYFICSEYGPNTGRPHYHGVLFTDVSPIFISRMFNDWSSTFGFTNFSEVCKYGSKRSSSSKVGNYVAKYCSKHSKFKSDVEFAIDSLIQSGTLNSTFYIMSKGIGLSYVNRLKRYHLPNAIRSPDERISKICDRAFYHDQTFKYKLPRYYRDRLYRVRMPFDSKVWNKKLKCYENKIVLRYCSKNMLSRQMQVEIRNRVLEEYNKRVEELRFINPQISRSEIDLQILRSDACSRVSRQKDITSKMSRFYNYNRFKNKF